MVVTTDVNSELTVVWLLGGTLVQWWGKYSAILWGGMKVARRGFLMAEHLVGMRGLGWVAMNKGVQTAVPWAH